MFVATFRRAAGNPSSFSIATAAVSAALGDPILEQFLPPREHPPPQLKAKLRLELLRHLAVGLKTDSLFSSSATSFLSGCRAGPLADFLRSLRHPIPGIAFVFLAFPNFSLAEFQCFCDAVFLLYSDAKLKTLAQDLLVGVLQRLDHSSGATLLRWAKLHSLHTRYHALHLVLRAFLGAGMVPEALEALSEVRSDGKTPGLSVHAILFRILFRMGDSRNAWKLFRDMILRGPRPSTKIFNAMILGSCLKGLAAAGEGLIWVMTKYKLWPDACSFNIVMKAHCFIGGADNAFKLFDKMIETGHVPSIVTYNILINALCRQGRMEEAREWFDHVGEVGIVANTITYNVLLDGYVKAGQIDVANSTYEEMIKKGMTPDSYTFNILVSGHCKFRRDKEELVQCLFRDALSDEVCNHMLLSNFCWSGQLEFARSMLINDVGCSFVPTVTDFNSIIACYSKEGMEEDAIHMYKVMLSEFGISPSSFTWQSLLLGLCRGGRLNEAEELLFEMIEKGFNVGVSALTIFIDGCFRFGEVAKAVSCWNYMEMKGISFDVVGFSAYINGLCRANSMEKALEAFWKMCSGGLVPNNFIYNSLISGLFRIGDIKEALKLEAVMRFNGLTPDIFTTNIVINGFCEARCLESADEKFKQMVWNGMHPDIVTYNTLIASCYKAFDVERAERYFKIMAFNCKPDIFTYNIRIHGLFSSYKVTEAIKTIDKLLSEDFAPNSVTHNTMMNAICVDDLGRAMILAAKLIKMALVPNVVTVNLLLSHFCKQGLVESALMWGEKFKKVYKFDNVTLYILDKASVLNQTSFKASSNVDSGKDLFLEFLMHITYELLCNSSDSSKHKPLAIKGLVDNGLQKNGLGMKGKP